MNLQHNMQVSERIASHRAAGPRPGGCGLVGLGPSMALPLRSAAFKSTLSARSYRHRRIAAAASPSGPGGPSSGDQQPWWDNLNKNSIQGPEPPKPLPPTGEGDLLLGERGYAKYVNIQKGERQRVWDVMRESARQRYEKGEMPSWFDPHWLTYEEAPVNRILREMGEKHYQYDDTWVGRPFNQTGSEPPELAQGGGDDGGSSGQGGSGGNNNRGQGKGRGWWREDDPYWMLRDWGDHPMRWWTLGFAALLAVGGLGAYVFHGSLESLFCGWGGGVWLALCSLAMSDMRTPWLGPFGVKMAFAACALLAIKDGLWGWSHRPHAARETAKYHGAQEDLDTAAPPAPWEWLIPQLPVLQLSGSGTAAAAMCGLYMWTGMSGLDEYALPLTPGAVYKSSDVVLKQRVWQKWGYSHVTMRP